MMSHTMRGHVVILVILTCGLIEPTLAVNFAQCLVDVRNGVYGPYGGTDAHGHPVSDISSAVGITYALCKRACETGPEAFNWQTFSQKFSAWLLPWLALISQLPFATRDRFENLTSVLLAVGSPTLAAYSVALTVLNGRWLARRLSDISHPNVDHAFRIMSSLQQAPLNIIKDEGLLPSLVVLPENDNWWEELVVWLDYIQTWSIAAATSILWVLLAYLFTVIGAFTGLPPNPMAETGGSDGQSVGTVWLWLLPIVIAWLQISPKCDIQRLRGALSRANKMAYVATDSGPQLAHSTDSKAQAFNMSTVSEDATHADEMCSAPIFNYSRFLGWTQNVEEVVAVFRHASRHPRPRVNGLLGVDGVDQSQIQPKNCRRNWEEVTASCTSSFSEARSRWGPDVWSRMLIASLVALLLQWGTSGAAILIIWYTPTVGLGCRSGSFLVYAAASTLAWMLLVTSSILTHFFAPSKESHPRTVGRLLAVTLRRAGKLLATCNAVWIIVVCTLQFGDFFDRCYCNSSVTGLKGGAYDILVMSANQVRGPWIGGLALACGSAFLFLVFVNLFIKPKPTRCP